MDKEAAIMAALQSNNYSRNELVRRNFGMQVIDQLTSIEARVLPSPHLQYHGSTKVIPVGDQWNMTNVKMINAGSVDYWAVVNFSCQREDAVKRFLNQLVRTCKNKGIGFKNQPQIEMVSTLPPYNIKKFFTGIKSKCDVQLAKEAPGNKLQLLFVIFPETKGIYEKIKLACETKLGIVCQCCKPHHVMKFFEHFCRTMAIKIIVNVGG
ncbi:putative ribonuclease H-like superfamily, argonaute linker 2 domain, protein argonaute, Mid [Helianthus annuus]|nr:putative ribonuclease H-like superfamily, argonaute linker 2 domain, protein argonaute, Mid [Helianthus annuus]